ncbi:hypothetical protein Tco_1327166 [Tanacetum coccineum]
MDNTNGSSYRHSIFIYEFLATPIDFSVFIMHRLKIDNLTQDLLTYDLIKGMCKSVVELEYHLKAVFKATNDQLDWYNPKGKSYPHDLSKPLSLILNERGRQVIPLDYFINNDLEYLKGGSSSQKYTTSITKTKAADYGQKFYGYATNMESSKYVYSRHMIIAITSLKIIQFFGYSHLEEIIVRRQDDQLYKLREGDFKRLCRQDIEDMLLLLAQFSDGTLNHVRTALNDITTGLEMDYLPKRKWSNRLAKRSFSVMIQCIDKQAPSDTQVITVKMEILLEPTSNKLMVVMRTDSAAAKPCQRDSLEFYLIIGSIYTDQRGTVVIATVFDKYKVNAAEGVNAASEEVSTAELFDRLADKQSGRPSGSLPSNTQPNPRGGNSKAYQPPQAHNEHVNAVFTRSGKSYNPPNNSDDQ